MRRFGTHSPPTGRSGAAEGCAHRAAATTVCAMRLPTRRTLVLPAAVAALIGALTACSIGGTHPSAATKKSKSAAAPTASATHDPLAGPIEPAAQLPKSCSKMLSDEDLTAAFGSPQVGDTTYGSFAPLPNIGRTGRVTCSFVIGIDPYGHPEPAGATVSIITYDTAVIAASRAVREVKDTVAKGATAQPVLVDGHPATILVAHANAPTAPAATTASAAATPSSPPTRPGASQTAAAAASSGYTELVMADGNRTFVITIPLSKVSGNAAATALVTMTVLVYQHTLPTTAPPASATASPKPSAT